jgi:hypothetical protein
MVLTLKKLFSTLLIILLVSGIIFAGSADFGRAQSSTPAGGIINVDTTWSKADSPYILTGALGIISGVTLTIEAGVTVHFSDNYMQVNGTLNAKGTSTDPIQFNGGANPAITFNGADAGNSIIENSILNSTSITIQGSSPKISSNTFNCRISIFEGSPQISNNKFIGGDGLVLYDSNAAISGNVFSGTSQAVYVGSSQLYSTPLIERNLIAGNGYGIIMPVSATFNPIIRNNTIANNTEGISIYNGGVPLPTIIYNNIYGNSRYNFRLTDIRVNVDAAQNWWGTTDAQAIGESIFDFKKDFNLGNVTFEPFLNELNTQAMPDGNVLSDLPTENPTAAPQPSAEPTPTPTPDSNNFNIESNSTVTEFSFNSSIPELTFTITGPDGTTGYVKAAISKNFMPAADNIKVYLDGNQTDYTLDSNSKSWIVTFTYNHSTHHVAINASADSAETTVFPDWVWTAATIAAAAVLIAAVSLLIWLTKLRAKPT